MPARSRRLALLRARARGKLIVLDRTPTPEGRAQPWSDNPRWAQPLRMGQGRITPVSIMTGSRMNGG